MGFYENLWGVDDSPYDEERLKAFYDKYNAEVISYFKDKVDQFLIVNLKDDDAVSRLKDFIGVSQDSLEEMPWENKT